jgi:hypothetical protein
MMPAQTLQRSPLVTTEAMPPPYVCMTSRIRTDKSTSGWQNFPGFGHGRTIGGYVPGRIAVYDELSRDRDARGSRIRVACLRLCRPFGHAMDDLNGLLHLLIHASV